VGEPVTDEQAQKAAFDEYVVPEIEVLYRVARSITRNPTDAEDLVQDTMLRAYRAIGRFDGRHPRAWLLTIMRNAQVNRVRRKRPELLRDPDTTMERLADEGGDDADPETLVVEAGYDAAVERAFDSLPDKFRSVVEMVDIQGLSYQEAADLLDVPIGTVMSRLHRARTRIRRHLEESGAYVGGRPT
jgi:RNA polymerase sigma-70 factor (ECF subfamily)